MITTLKNKNTVVNVFTFSFFLSFLISNAQVGNGTTVPKSTFKVSESNGQSVMSVTASLTLNETHNNIMCNNGSTTITITLPA